MKSKILKCLVFCIVFTENVKFTYSDTFEDFSTEVFDDYDENDSSYLLFFEEYNPEYLKPRIIFYCFDDEDNQINIFNVNVQVNDFEKISKYINPDLETKIIIHGWMTNAKDSSVWGIVEEYRKIGKFNIISVNWYRIAFELYSKAASYTKSIGIYISELIKYLIINHNLNPNKIHIIGHSLGAHIAGFVGKNLNPIKIKRITGLDPANPIFGTHSTEMRLDKSDADFVDVIHTSGGTCGVMIPLGHVDFYPNGGKSVQPGCPRLILFYRIYCSHTRAVHYFIESIRYSKSFYSEKCKSWEHYKRSECENVYCEMGENASRDCKEGNYYLRTNSKTPYAKENYIY